MSFTFLSKMFSEVARDEQPQTMFSSSKANGKTDYLTAALDIGGQNAQHIMCQSYDTKLKL